MAMVRGRAIDSRLILECHNPTLNISKSQECVNARADLPEFSTSATLIFDMPAGFKYINRHNGSILAIGVRHTFSTNRSAT
jgi:hypothetical protein